MEILILAFVSLVVLVLIVLARAVFAAIKQSQRIPEESLVLHLLGSLGHESPTSSEDQIFEETMLRMVGPNVEKYFYNKVVGVSFKNEDGTSREEVIGRLKQFDFLDLVCEPDNPHDPDAVAVHRKGGGQVGYLQARTAQDVARSIRKRGKVWLACVKWAQGKGRNRHASLTICLIRMESGTAKAHHSAQVTLAKR
jgi:hypothetical protein